MADYAELGIDPASVPPHPAVAAFRNGMREIAREGDYIDIVTEMFCAEWMYWHWCRRAAAAPIADRGLRRWVDLHAEEAFAAQALRLKSQVDQAGPDLDAAPPGVRGARTLRSRRAGRDSARLGAAIRPLAFAAMDDARAAALIARQRRTGRVRRALQAAAAHFRTGAVTFRTDHRLARPFRAKCG